MAWPSHLFGRWLGMLHARYSGLTKGVWPADAATAWVRLSRRPAPGAVPCRQRCASQAGGRASPHPRSRPGAGGASELTRRRCAGGRSGPLFVCPCGPPRPGQRARRATCRRAPDCGCHTGPAFCQTERATDVCRQRRATVPLAQSARLPRPTRGVVEIKNVSLVAFPGDISGRISLAARLIGTCEYALRRGRPTRPTRVSGAADPDDQQRSNLKARLGVRQPMAVDIFLTIRWIVERNAR
jgi:hypothetical protein